MKLILKISNIFYLIHSHSSSKIEDYSDSVASVLRGCFIKLIEIEHSASLITVAENSGWLIRAKLTLITM